MATRLVPVGKAVKVTRIKLRALEVTSSAAMFHSDDDTGCEILDGLDSREEVEEMMDTTNAQEPSPQSHIINRSIISRPICSVTRVVSDLQSAIIVARTWGKNNWLSSLV